MHLLCCARNQLYLFIGENFPPTKDPFYPSMQKRILSSSQKCAFQIKSSKSRMKMDFRNCWYSSVAGCHIFDVTRLMKIGKLFLFPLKTDVQNVQRARDRFYPGAIFSNGENYFIVFEARLQNKSDHWHSHCIQNCYRALKCWVKRCRRKLLVCSLIHEGWGRSRFLMVITIENDVL